MSLTIKTNMASLIAQGSLTNSTNKLNQAIERMTTGYKINHASDNAANYSISTNMTTKINAYQVAEDNVRMGLDLVQTASSTLESMGDLTTRLRALATQAQNGTYGNQSINALTKEANSIVAEINRLQTTAEYNGIKLFANTATQSLDSTNPIATYSGDVAVQSSSSKFIAPIARRDTSSMTKLSSVDENTTLSSGTYSISTAEELAKLATMTNNGKIGTNTEFVLSNDIDLSAYSTGEGWIPIGNDSNNFQAIFDGNGYTISNLYINRPNADNQGLFSYVTSAKAISNLSLKNAEVIGHDNVGGIAAVLYGATMINCSASGNISGYSQVGVLAGLGFFATITNCYSSGAVKATSNDGDAFGSLVGNGNYATISNSYSTGSVTGNIDVGGMVGRGEGTNISNCYATGNVVGSSSVGGLVGSVNGSTTFYNSYFTETTGQAAGIGSGTPKSGSVTILSTLELNAVIGMGELPSAIYVPTGGNSPTPTPTPTPSPSGGGNLILQVGVNANDSSQIGLTIQGIDLSALKNLDLQSDTVFETLDGILAKINNQQTSLGAVQNRLMSALDEISTQYENLVSSRSTLRDAEIADVSSEYIKMQILQNASATLLATANQSPALALQLL